MIRLASTKGTKETLVLALVLLVADSTSSFELSPGAMDKLGVIDGSTIDILADQDNDNLWIALVGEKEGRAVSKHGRVSSGQMRSWLAGTEYGTDAVFQITDETTSFDGYEWNKLAIFNASVEEEAIETHEDKIAKAVEKKHHTSDALDHAVKHTHDEVDRIVDTEQY
jgi:hypothetical protein